MSISDARNMGIVKGKSTGKKHYADVARAQGKHETQVKAWSKLQKEKS
jgi:hypothetical protein